MFEGFPEKLLVYKWCVISWSDKCVSYHMHIKVPLRFFFFFVSTESSVTQCCENIQYRQTGSQLALIQWLCNTIVYDTGVISTEAVCVCVCVCVSRLPLLTCAHMRVSACARTCVYPHHRAAVKWVNALKGLLGSPARSLPAIMRMFSVFSSISARGSLRRESLADARHVADVCCWSDIWK